MAGRVEILSILEESKGISLSKRSHRFDYISVSRSVKTAVQDSFQAKAFLLEKLSVTQQRWPQRHMIGSANESKEYEVQRASSERRLDESYHFHNI
jgi:hypothetical protein